MYVLFFNKKGAPKQITINSGTNRNTNYVLEAGEVVGVRKNAMYYTLTQKGVGSKTVEALPKNTTLIEV